MDLLISSPVEGGQASLISFVFIIIPYAITSFGYHGNVCSLYKLYHENESEVRKRMAIAESFILACLTAVDEPLDLDLLYGFPCHQQRVQPQNITVLR